LAAAEENEDKAGMGKERKFRLEREYKCHGVPLKAELRSLPIPALSSFSSAAATSQSSVTGNHRLRALHPNKIFSKKGPLATGDGSSDVSILEPSQMRTRPLL